jgi:hypothetical protein
VISVDTKKADIEKYYLGYLRALDAASADDPDRYHELRSRVARCVAHQRDRDVGAVSRAS